MPSSAETRETVLVDPRAPRFGQSITAGGLVAGVVLSEPLFVYAVAAVLGLAVVSGWRLDVYSFVWSNFVSEFVGKPGESESAAPPRFAKLLGATFTSAASIAFVAGFPLVGYVLAGGVAVLSGVAATTGFCVGCKMYRQVSFLRRIGVV